MRGVCLTVLLAGGEMTGCAANAGDPEQDAWFRRFMEHLEEEPQWRDGEVLVT